MATGALDANGIWQYGEDDSETTFSGLLNKLASSTSDTVTRLESFTGYTGTLPVANGGTGATSAVNARTNLGLSGAVLQVKSTTLTSTASSSLTTFSSLMNVSITPVSTSSKILVIYNVNMAVATANWGAYLRLVRNSTQIYLGDTAGSRKRVSNYIYPTNTAQIFTASGNFLDSPATTTATTYHVEIACQNSSYPVVINRAGTDTDVASNPSLASTITVMEVAS